jgi:hypothetical protein
MKTKILLTVFILTFTAIQVNAQSHISTGDYKCLLVPNSGNGLGGVSCPACQVKIKKEREAKAVEDKRRAVAQAEKNKADQIARQKTLEKEKKENEVKLKASEVYMTMPKSTSVKNTTPSKKTEQKVTQKIYFYTDMDYNYNQSFSKMIYSPNDSENNSYFIVNNKKVFTNNEFKKCVGTYAENKYNFPPNVGIVVLNESFTNKKGEDVPIYDLIDSKGNRILKDNSVSMILHFVDDYFILFTNIFNSSYETNTYRLPADSEASIFNLKTKEKYPIRKFMHEGKDYGYEFSLGINSSKNIKLNENKYKSFFQSTIDQNEIIYYYITKDGKIEEQIVKY